MNSIYSCLSSMKFIGKSYNYKFLFIAFIGIHIPLIGLIIFITTKPQSISPLSIFFITVLLTLGATALTLYLLHGLLEPLSASQKALDKYLVKRVLPELPEHFEDEAGLLMNSVQQTVISFDNLLKEKRDFIGLLSHDLRIPMANIRLLSQNMERIEVMSDAQRKKTASLITDSVNEQMALFQKVLRILRDDEIHALELNIEKVSCEKLISDAVAELKALADDKDILINIMSARDATFNVDVKMLSQVIKNLVNNAVKFSNRGSEINIYIESMQHKTRISVQDNGVGFYPADCNRLFQRFSQLSHAGTENEVSTGMGLYLSQKIVEAHKGKITADSMGINRGAVFVIEI